MSPMRVRSSKTFADAKPPARVAIIGIAHGRTFSATGATIMRLNMTRGHGPDQIKPPSKIRSSRLPGRARSWNGSAGSSLPPVRTSNTLREIWQRTENINAVAAEG